MSSAPSQAQDQRQDQPEVPNPGRAKSGRRWRWVAFGVVITAAAMDLLDSTIAQVAAPTIRRELGGSYAVIEWVTAGSGAGTGSGAGSGGARWGRLDLPGAVLAGAAMFLLVFPLAQGHSLGWPAWLYAMLAASVLVLAGFGWYQVRRQRAGRDPLVEPSLFRRGPYRAGIVFSIVFTGSLGGIVMIFNVFLQNGLGFSPWHSAITISDV